MTTEIYDGLNNSFYNTNAEQLAEQYLSKSFEEVHASWLSHLPSILKVSSSDDITTSAPLTNSPLIHSPSIHSFNNSPIRILDIGAGAGRDAKYLAEQGTASQAVQVYAVEPAQTLANLGKQLTSGLNVRWFQDSLPALDTVSRQEVGFDLILLSAVWMHIPVSQRARSIRKLANLLKPNGKLVISLRHGPSGDARKMHDVSIEELETLGPDVGLAVIDKTAMDTDKLGRPAVHWQTVVLQLPDDGMGAFPTLRHIIINDDKSSTYKLALLRVLLRIADGHPGAVTRTEENNVIIPMGLVALYWCHQFKPLLDNLNIRQNSDPTKGMGFVKANGWNLLKARVADDYVVGNLFIGDDAKRQTQGNAAVTGMVSRQ
ncbi:conserved protein of unknown function, might belong to SAM-dependent methlyltransferase [Shewanella benthica]|uniref:Methyltransferase domain-containing protein n=1 Tax=Shewanella benthica TaxID=43661 RepID=A0A330M3R4_9GAMM|nr:class I SAM-dependent methyltransferase [Shewanella benthica]SQH76712.1 conserved protein of unknown function, might belong to SAM-dependent methlyltransferase [Shewanella benthica]